MTIASEESAKKQKTRITVDEVVAAIRMKGPITAHDLCVWFVTSGKFAGHKEIFEAGQIWSELVSRISTAAKKGLLDDTLITKESGNPRTLYRVPEKRLPVRHTKAEILEAELEKLKAENRELKIKLECCHVTIDKLSQNLPEAA